jgi:peptide deformylase
VNSKLIMYGNPILTSVAEPVSDYDSVAGIVPKLQEIMTGRRVNWISAKHLGINSRLIVIERSNQDESGYLTLINPEILSHHGPILSRVESDFSLPELHVSVERRADALVRYFDEHGTVHDRKFVGPTGRLIQQAIDQLDGKLMTINLHRYRRQSIKGYLRNLSRKFENQPKSLVNHE